MRQIFDKLFSQFLILYHYYINLYLQATVFKSSVKLRPLENRFAACLKRTDDTHVEISSSCRINNRHSTMETIYPSLFVKSL